MEVAKKILGVLLIVIGFISIVTPLTPFGWLIFVGFGLFGYKMISFDNNNNKKE